LQPDPSTDRWADDKVAFAREALGLVLDDWQTRVLQSPSPRKLLNITRQGGKSTISAVLGLHESIYKPDSLTVILSPSQRQSGELFRKVTRFRERLPFVPELTEDNRLSMTVRGGGRVISLPSSESTVRGFSAVTLLIADEAARIPDDLYLACRPMLATKNGTLILMSTPFGKRGFFWQAWEAEAIWHKEEVTAAMIPRITPEFLAEEESLMPLNWYLQEYFCQFTESTDSVFRYEDVMNALDDDLEPFFGASGNDTLLDDLQPFEELA
jgi:Terminase large subunit, T4likevirus-type, N-terminal